MNVKNEKAPVPAQVKTATDLGHYLRAYRKSKGVSLERLAGLSNVSIKFLSEFERGKETAEIGKVLKVMHVIGLETIVQPRTVGGRGRRAASPASISGTGSVIKNKE